MASRDDVLAWWDENPEVSSTQVAAHFDGAHKPGKIRKWRSRRDEARRAAARRAGRAETGETVAVTAAVSPAFRPTLREAALYDVRALAAGGTPKDRLAHASTLRTLLAIDPTLFADLDQDADDVADVARLERLERKYAPPAPLKLVQKG